MRPVCPPDNKCPQNQDVCNLACKYNFFEADDLTIHSYELKCLDCGYRETIAYRSDDSDVDLESCDPERCPFCLQSQLRPGHNPCQGQSS